MGSAASAGFRAAVSKASVDELTDYLQPITPQEQARIIECIKDVECRAGSLEIPMAETDTLETTSSPQNRLKQPLSCRTKFLEESQFEKLMPLEESRKLVAAPAPEEKPILGTATSEFVEVVPQLDSGISDALDSCFGELSADIFGLPFSVSVAIPTIEDCPLIGISDGFLKLSGYSREEIVGRNCRLLLDKVPKDQVRPGVRLEARQYCRAAHLRKLTSMAHSIHLQRNGRKNGELFWNLFMLSVVPGPDKKRTYVVGLQLDLGPELPPEHQTCPEAAIEAHRDHLLLVQNMMFGKPIPTSPSFQTPAAQAFMGLNQDIKSWIAHAEAQSAQFQEWGTLPWVAWPGPTAKHALLNGGVSILRLNADEIATGARAMTIFPMDKARAGQRTLKVNIDEICPRWGTKVPEGAHLPILGFTQSTPATVDQIGGLPDDLQNLADTICMRGDGQLYKTTGGETKLVATAKQENNYEMQAGDSVEFIWCKNSIRFEINNEVIYSAKDESIGNPPKGSLFGIVECANAACRMTLMA